MSKRMQELENGETLYKSSARIWEKAFVAYDAPAGTDYQPIEKYYYYVWGFVGMPRSEHTIHTSQDSLRAELGDLRQWRIEGAEVFDS